MQRKTFGKKPGPLSPARQAGVPASDGPAQAAAALPSYASLLGEAAPEDGEDAGAVPARPSSPASERDMILSFGSEWRRMRNVWTSMTTGGLGLSWSWPAFCFHGLWFLYRRQYLWGIVVLLAMLGSEFLGLQASIIAVFAISVVCGLIGRRVLVGAAMKNVQYLKRRGGEESAVETRISGFSGTDMLTPLVFTAGFVYLKLMLVRQMLAKTGYFDIFSSLPF